MKFIKTTIVAAIMAFSLNATAQNNLLNSDVYTFENPGKALWIQHKANWELTSEKAFEGKQSLKFNCDDLSTVKGSNMAAQIGTTGDKPNDGTVKLYPGTYTISMMVWLGENAPLSFGTNLAANGSSPFVQISWKLKKTVKGEWVELTQKFTLEKAVSTKMAIQVSTNPKWGGAGVLYIDDIKITQ
ncbi:hypothetical protein [Saccharicrinis aurantiacus]|uniref:hypothetical protein n=1 Tax=Saccharicrinis aurantiacus TaxID=1849719 RepID=UPI00249264E7|nr:hypothetical protein [Saccharicrinis aurantiacus]